MIAESIYQRIANDRKWFIGNFKQIYRNRDKFALGTPNASLVIDCFTIFSIGGCAGYRSIQRIHIGRLVKLWEMGFKYADSMEQYDIAKTAKRLVEMFEAAIRERGKANSR